MKYWALALAAYACTGCTMMSLERHTVALTDSAVDLRYQEVMDNLAVVANDPSTLPSYSSIFAGSATVTDQEQLISTTVWQHVLGRAAQNGFASEAANASGNRTILENWVLDPIVMPEKMEALRAACQWAIGGPEHVYKDSMSLLIDPDKAPPGPGRHFNVADRLERLPEGWLRVGCRKDVPVCARYKARSGDCWVWVTAEGINGLADFTLILQKIARVDSNSPTLFNLPPAYQPIRIETAESPLYENKQDPKAKQIRITATLYVDQGGHLVPDTPYYPMRQENRGLDPHFRSQINAAVATPH